METALEELNEGLTVLFTHAGDVEGYPVHLQFGLRLVIVELRPIESDEFENDHSDGEEIRFEGIVFDFVFEIAEVRELLWRQYILVNETFLR